MNDDTDLRALREFRSALDKPRDGALARGRWRLAKQDPLPRARARRTWLLAGAAGALSVAVMVGGAATVQLAAGDPVREATPAEQAPSVAAPARDVPVTPGRLSGKPVTGGAGGTHDRAVEALTRLAAAQDDAPLAVGPGAVLYVKSYNTLEGDGRYIHEAWQAVDLGTPLRVRRTDGSVTLIDDTLSPAEIQEAVMAAQAAPTLLNLLPGYAANLPSDPQQLLASWRAWAERDHPGRDPDKVIMKQLHELFHYVDPLLTVRQRATVYLSIARMPQVKATTADVGGEALDVVCLAGECSLFDTASGRYAGSATTGADMVLKADAMALVEFAVLPRPQPGPERPQQTEKPQTEKPMVSGSATTPKR